MYTLDHQTPRQMSRLLYDNFPWSSYPHDLIIRTKHRNFKLWWFVSFNGAMTFEQRSRVPVGCEMKGRACQIVTGIHVHSSENQSLHNVGIVRYMFGLNSKMQSGHASRSGGVSLCTVAAKNLDRPFLPMRYSLVQRSGAEKVALVQVCVAGYQHVHNAYIASLCSKV